MRALIACEYSGRVREAFRARGHDAWSCDLLQAEDDGPCHIQGDVIEALTGHTFPVNAEEHGIIRLDFGEDWRWDLMIAHPPCTHLAVSGARWFPAKRKEQEAALEFVRQLMAAPIERICIENPVSIISSRIRKPDQIIQPWQFGHRETKATCLWLKGLPPLQPTKIVGPPRTPEEKREFAKVHMMRPGPDRWKDRSRTYTGIAEAMAEQWG